MILSYVRSSLLRFVALVALSVPLLLVTGSVSHAVQPSLASLVSALRRQGLSQVSVSSMGSGVSPLTVQRINQLDPAQYQNWQEYETWWPSACSAASMAEVLNAYGGRYRITDVLAVERQLGAISVQEGLLGDAQIERILQHFHFAVSWGYDLTLDQVIAQANEGRPVIVSFPPQSGIWSGGHILLVVGGDGSSVRVVDSSSYDLRVLARSPFLSWWRGFSAVATPDGSVAGLSVVGGPSISPDGEEVRE